MLTRIFILAFLWQTEVTFCNDFFSQFIWNVSDAVYNISSLSFDFEHRSVSCDLKVHKIENFFGSEFEFYTISLLVMLKY